MYKPRSTYSRYSFYGGRYDYLPPARKYVVKADPQFRQLILSLEDRRLWNPEPFLSPSPASLTRAARRLVIPGRRRSSSRVGFLGVPGPNAIAIPGTPSSLVAPSATLSPAVGFAQPSKVSLCVRRHVRREVIFAKGVGGGKVRRGKRNQWSEIQC